MLLFTIGIVETFFQLYFGVFKVTFILLILDGPSVKNAKLRGVFSY